jgi:hypothetical protein
MTALLMAQSQIDTTTPVEATATFDPPAVRPGDTAIYRVTFNAMMDSIQWPEEIIAPQALELKRSARGQTYTSAGAVLQPRTTFNYRVRATKAGSFTVSRFIVYVYGKAVTVPEAKLDVMDNLAAGPAASPRLLLEVGATNVFAGQSIPVRVLAPGTTNGIVQALQQVQFNGDGFMADPNSMQQRVQRLPERGNLPCFIYEVKLTALKPGPQELSVQGFTAGNMFTGPIVITGGGVTIPGGPPQFTLLDSPPVTVNVRPLPREKELPGYAGAMGHFKLDPPVLATNFLRVGDPVTLTVTVRGEGNLARLVPPPPPQAAGWRIFPGNPDNAIPQLVQARGFSTFSFTLIPTTEESRATPVIPFSYFDPDKGAFVKLDIPAVAVTVKPGAAPVDAAALVQAEPAAPEREKEPKLSALASAPGRTMAGLVPFQRRVWFPLVQLAPAVVFLGLWWWDQRRRYFAAHPEILLRRRARKALRREWAALRQAASLGDTSRFAACAVNAMRAACAPHYPAEPRALVSSDVLPLLPVAAPDVGHVVRRVFAAADAERFAAQPAVERDLLALRAEVDRVLTQLEAKL